MIIVKIGRVIMMSLPLSFEWRIITEDKERRINIEENLFEIEFSGYKIFPINEPIEIIRYADSEQIGTAVINKITFENNKTICSYQLISLYSVN
jgi:hypothetical protein